VSGSVSFDRAVEYYDRTRGLSEDASRATTALLAEELRGRGRCLEIGVGTGLVALPLAHAGVPLVGLDLSAPMLARLVEKAGGRAPFPLVIGDATAIPFVDQAFGAALLRHVLHLIPDWERAVAELTRVVARPGLVLVATGDIPVAWREVASRFTELAGGFPVARGLDIGRELERLDEAFRSLGSDAPRNLPSVHDEVRQSLAEFLDQMSEGLHSWTWEIDDAERRRIVEEVRAWALQRFSTLDPPGSRDVAIQWRAYDLP
jgi:SAM-dependent methyltransferase